MIDPLSTTAFVADATFAGLAFVFMAALVRSNDKRRIERAAAADLAQENVVLEGRLKRAKQDAETLAKDNLRLNEQVRSLQLYGTFKVGPVAPAARSEPVWNPATNRFHDPITNKMISTKAGAATAG